MSQHLQKIFDVWDGNAEAMAADIAEKGVTVRQWRNRGDIPSRSAQLKIIKAAFEKNGTVLCLEDFLPAEVRAELPGHGAEAVMATAPRSATNGGENIGTSQHGVLASGADIGTGEGRDCALQTFPGGSECSSPFPNAPEEGLTPPSSGATSPTSSSTSEHPHLPLGSPGYSTFGGPPDPQSQSSTAGEAEAA